MDNIYFLRFPRVGPLQVTASVRGRKSLSGGLRCVEVCGPLPEAMPIGKVHRRSWPVSVERVLEDFESG